MSLRAGHPGAFGEKLQRLLRDSGRQTSVGRWGLISVVRPHHQTGFLEKSHAQFHHLLETGPLYFSGVLSVLDLVQCSKAFFFKLRSGLRPFGFYHGGAPVFSVLYHKIGSAKAVFIVGLYLVSTVGKKSSEKRMVEAFFIVKVAYGVEQQVGDQGGKGLGFIISLLGIFRAALSGSRAPSGSMSSFTFVRYPVR